MIKEGKHTVFVLSKDNKPLTPTTPERALNLIEDGRAEMVRNDFFGVYGIRMLEETGEEVLPTTIKISPHDKYDIYSVICSDECVFSTRIDYLCSKKKIIRKKKIKDKNKKKVKKRKRGRKRTK